MSSVNRRFKNNTYHIRTGLSQAGLDVAVQTAVDAALAGYMDTATYDPGAVSGDVFDMANMTENTDAKVMTAAERTAIASNTTARHVHTQTASEAIADTDHILGIASDNTLKRWTWAWLYAKITTLLASVFAPLTALTDRNEPTGFLDWADAVGSYDNATRTFTLTPASSTYTVWSAGTRITGLGAQSVVWPNTEGTHFFYLDTSGVLQTTTTFAPSDYIYGDKCYVANLYWNAVDGAVVLDAIIERHGIQQDGESHYQQHLKQGAYWVSGLTLGNILADQDGSLDTHAQFSVSSGTIGDEDMRFTTPALSVGGNIPILYLSGAGLLRDALQSGFAVLTDTTAGVGATGRLVYNLLTGSTWSLATVTDNRFVLCHILSVGTETAANRVYALVGQNMYTSLADARAGATTEIESIKTVINLQEIRPVATLIYQTKDTYTNQVKARIRTTDEGDDYINQLSVRGGAGAPFTATDHNSTTNRDAPDAHPASSVDAVSISLITGAGQKLRGTASATMEAVDPTVALNITGAATPALKADRQHVLTMTGAVTDCQPTGLEQGEVAHGVIVNGSGYGFTTTSMTAYVSGGLDEAGNDGAPFAVINDQGTYKWVFGVPV